MPPHFVTAVLPIRELYVILCFPSILVLCAIVPQGAPQYPIESFASVTARTPMAGFLNPFSERSLVGSSRGVQKSTGIDSQQRATQIRRDWVRRLAVSFHWQHEGAFRSCAFRRLGVMQKRRAGAEVKLRWAELVARWWPFAQFHAS